MDIEEIKIRVGEVIASSDVSEARAIMNELSVAGALVDGNDEASALLRQLLFLRLPQLDPEQAAWLLQHYVLDAFAIADFDFPNRVEDTLAIIPDTDKRSDVLHHFLTAVETCEQLLGDKPVIIDGAELPPTVEHWLKDYAFWPTENKFRQSFDAVNYVSKAPNPQKLSGENRTLLIRLLGWCDQIRNTLYDYQNSEEIDLEEYPNLDPRLLTGSIDEFDSPEAAREALDKALAVKRPNPLSGMPAVGSTKQSSFVPPSFPPVNTPRPNIQGVLSNAPLKKTDSQEFLPKPEPIKPEPIVSPSPLPEQPKVRPVVPPVFSPPPREPAVLRQPEPKPAVPVTQNNTGGAKPVLPAKVPDNLPMVEPEDLPAVMQPKAPLVAAKKPPVPAQRTAPSLPPTLNMNRIQTEVARQKGATQEDIDQRLASLKNRSGKK